MAVAFKVVRADDRRSAFAVPGLIYAPGTVIVHRSPSRGVWAYATREIAESAHPTTDPSKNRRIVELEYEEPDCIVHSPGGVLRLMVCRVLPEPGERVPRNPPVIDVPTPKEHHLERVATLRATAILGGRRQLHHEDANELGHLVHQKVAAAKRRANGKA